MRMFQCSLIRRVVQLFQIKFTWLTLLHIKNIIWSIEGSFLDKQRNKWKCKWKENKNYLQQDKKTGPTWKWGERQLSLDLICQEAFTFFYPPLLHIFYLPSFLLTFIMRLFYFLNSYKKLLWKKKSSAKLCRKMKLLFLFLLFCVMWWSTFITAGKRCSSNGDV